MQTLLPMLCALLALGLSADAPWLVVFLAAAGATGFAVARRAVTNVSDGASPSHATPHHATTHHALRAALFLFVAWLFYINYSGENSGAPEALMAWGVARLAAGEWALRCWLREGFVGERRALRILLPALVLMGACNTFETQWVRWLVPLWFCLALLSTVDFDRTQSRNPAARRGISFRALSIAFVLLCGVASHGLVSIYRYDIAQIGARMLGARASAEAVGLSMNPRLGATFGASGSLTRVLRLRNWPGDRTYLRALSFDEYHGGAWLPTLDQKKFFPVTLQWLHANAGGERATVERLINDENLLLTPLDAAGIAVPPGDAADVTFEWTRGGPLRSSDNAPDNLRYDIVFPASADKPMIGPLAQAPTSAEYRKLRNVPASIPLEVHLLAQQIAGGLVDPREQIRAVETYLMAHHNYSLTTNPGAGDPVANFLGSDKAAHCEYFASAAVMLLRCLGLPARYTIGYYVHEKDGDATIVRFRDAHAWAECYIAGKGGGWVTVEATPGGARPDARGEPIPFWQKLREHTQDLVAALRAAALALAKTPRGLVLFITAFFALIGIVFAIRKVWKLIHRTSDEFVCQERSRELEEVARRFERWLRRNAAREEARLPRGTAAPVRTWRETASTPLLENNPLVREWLGLYDAARFGSSAVVVTRLHNVLARLERSAIENEIQGETNEILGNRHAH